MTLLLAVLFSIGVSAAKVTVNVRYMRNRNPEYEERERKPMNLPISVTFDTEVGQLDIEAEGSLEGCIYLYRGEGIYIDYSPVLNTSFLIATSGTYSISIIGDGWSGVGELVL